MLHIENADFSIVNPNPRDISFSAMQSSANVTVTITHDTVAEGDELIMLGLDTDISSNDINVGSVISTTEITILENDCE